MTAKQLDRDWASAWPDAVAFVSVLALAWWTQASAKDLIWSLWLSSLFVGYSIGVWTILRPILQLFIRLRQDREIGAGTRTVLAGSTIDTTFDVTGAVVKLAAFTVVFGYVHYFYASMLDLPFHLGAPHDWHRSARAQEIETFRLILGRYWRFLPAAFLAERAAFQHTPGIWAIRSPGTVAEDAERRATGDDGTPKILLLPYQKMLRMHLLSFFYIIAYVANFDNFVVYMVVYAAYFFPWRLLDPPPKPYTWPTGPVERR